MVNFFAVVPALEQGRSVRMSRWEAETKMFVDGGKLVCQRGRARPYEYNPSWDEMHSKKWTII